MTKKLSNVIAKINPILKKYQIKKASIFGSFARGEENKNSDLDLLVEMGSIGGLMAMGRLKMDLEDALKRKVDLLTFKSVSHLIAENINKDKIQIYAKR